MVLLSKKVLISMATISERMSKVTNLVKKELSRRNIIEDKNLVAEENISEFQPTHPIREIDNYLSPKLSPLRKGNSNSLAPFRTGINMVSNRSVCGRYSPKIKPIAYPLVKPGKVVGISRDEVTRCILKLNADYADQSPKGHLQMNRKDDFVLPSCDPSTKFSKSGLAMKDKHSNFENMRQESEQRLQRAFNAMVRRSAIEQSLKPAKSKRAHSRYRDISSKKSMSTIIPVKHHEQLGGFKAKNTTKPIQPLDVNPPFKTGAPNGSKELIDPENTKYFNSLTNQGEKSILSTIIDVF
jgi:hypothetical protein